MGPRSFIVTGAGTGIGRAIALRLAADGHRLGLVARDANRLEQTATAARSAGADRVSVHGCDIRSATETDTAIAKAADALGPLHGIVANSGIGGPNAPGADDRWAELISTNLSGTYHCLRATQAHLAPGPDPRHMVVISSVLGRFGVPGYTGYCASKTGLLGLVRALALELADDGVRVNAICPGWIDTQMAWEGIDGMADAMGTTREEAHRTAMKSVPQGQMGTPADIAGTVAWLLSPDGQGVTGQGIDVNGGAWMG